MPVPHLPHPRRSRRLGGVTSVPTVRSKRGGLIRYVFSAISLLLAVLFSATSLAGYQVDQLLRSEEPVREIAGDLPQQEDFATAVSELVVEEVSAELPPFAASAVDGVGGRVVESLVDSLRDDEDVRIAWEETLQQTRTDYTGQLESIFSEGTSGDTDELAVPVDLEPLSEAVTAPLRDTLDSALGWLPFVDEGAFDVLSPEIVVDVEAAAPDSTDPYTWATVAVLSRYWLAFAVAGAVLLLIGLALGPGRSRWAGLAVSGLVAAGIGLWIALRVASPEATAPDGFGDAAAAILAHVQERFTDWAQPSWWVYTGCAAGAVVIGILGVLLHPRRPAERASRRVSPPA